MDIFTEKTILTVSRLTLLIRGVVEENFEHIWVEGEVSNLSLPSSGHIYFTLKDASAQIRCVMFKGSAKNLKFRLSDGMAIIIRGRVSVYDQRGEYQIIIEYMEPQGVGALQLAFEQLKMKLSSEGLFDQARKKQLPSFPQRIGIITSPTGATIHDILNIMERRYSSLHIMIYPVRVQGEGAGKEIADAISEMNRMGEADLLIVGRGGGSLEDLWAFNEEIVARSVFNSRIPVISAVGHETDWTICDFVADLRAPTPSAAAELVSTTSGELREKVAALSHRLNLGATSILTSFRYRIDSLLRSLHDPTTMLGHLAQRTDDLSSRLERAAEYAIQKKRETFERHNQTLHFNAPANILETSRLKIVQLQTASWNAVHRIMQSRKLALSEQSSRLEALSPLSTLARGFSIASRIDNGRTVNDARNLITGDRLLLKLHHGSAECLVESTDTGKS